MAYFLGIDSGGTKTTCWLGDEQHVLARVSGPTVKCSRVGESLATERMQAMLHALEQQAAVSLAQLTRTCVGISGFSIAEVRDWAERVLRASVGGTVEVIGDDEIALDAAFHGGPGILVISGTGAIVLGRCADGTRHSAGGWGPAIGDEGSGYWIGREAVRKIFRAQDEGVATTLSSAICHAWGAAELAGVVGLANARPGPDFAELVPVVVRCAAAGDVLAQRLLAKAGNELGKQVIMVWSKMRSSCVGPLQVAYTGSVIEKIAPVRARMVERLATECPGLTVMQSAVNAVEGALWRARNAAD